MDFIVVGVAWLRVHPPIRADPPTTISVNIATTGHPLTTTVYELVYSLNWYAIGMHRSLYNLVAQLETNVQDVYSLHQTMVGRTIASDCPSKKPS